MAEVPRCGKAPVSRACGPRRARPLLVMKNGVRQYATDRAVGAYHVYAIALRAAVRWCDFRNGRTPGGADRWCSLATIPVDLSMHIKVPYSSPGADVMATRRRFRMPFRNGRFRERRADRGVRRRSAAGRAGRAGGGDRPCPPGFRCIHRVKCVTPGPCPPRRRARDRGHLSRIARPEPPVRVRPAGGLCCGWTAQLGPPVPEAGRAGLGAFSAAS